MTVYTDSEWMGYCLGITMSTFWDHALNLIRHFLSLLSSFPRCPLFLSGGACHLHRNLCRTGRNLLPQEQCPTRNPEPSSALSVRHRTSWHADHSGDGLTRWSGALWYGGRTTWRLYSIVEVAGASAHHTCARARRQTTSLTWPPAEPYSSFFSLFQRTLIPSASKEDKWSAKSSHPL